MSETHTPRQRSGRPFWVMVALFVVVVLALQWGWNQARHTVIERAVIDVATVRTTVAIIHQFSPEMAPEAAGSRIKATGGAMNVLNGCEGTEVLFLLIAALIAYPLSWQWRAIGLAGGVVCVFALNQLRLLALFYSYRFDRSLFDPLHGWVAPLLLLALALAYVVWVIGNDDRWHARKAAQTREG
jgi:exosortase/archaeosortase family protein